MGNLGFRLQEICYVPVQSPNGVYKWALLGNGGGSSWAEHMPDSKLKNWTVGTSLKKIKP